MISIFGNKTTKEELISTNSKYVLDSICVECTETEGLNGVYEGDYKFVIDKDFPKEAYDLIENDSYLKVDGEFGVEYFKIAQVRKNSKKYITAFARHITISECLNLWCDDVRPTDQSGSGAIDWIFTYATGNNWLNVSSDISGMNTAYYENKSVYNALFVEDNCFLNRWGGEVLRRGFNLSINSRVGANNSVEIRSRKNLKGLEIETNLNSLCTRIYPKGFDGITINEKYVDSPLIGNYSKVYPREVKFDDIKVKSETVEEGYETLAEAQAELKRRSKLLFSKEKIDIISATYRVDFVELAKTEEYKNYSALEKTQLGDTVKVYDETLNVNILVRVIKRVYDCLKKERINTELSNKDTKEKPPTIQDIFNKLEEVPDFENVLAEAKKQATALINAGLKDSYVVVRPNEILIMDTKDINTAIKVWRWNQGGLGYSSTGYYGQYGIAMTNNGAIVADFITTGVLNANLIKTGILRSFNEASWINMQTGEFNLSNKISFVGGVFSIDLGDKGLATDEELKFEINEVNKSINSKVSNDDFSSYKSQTAGEISSKVAKGTEFSTEFNQNAQGFNFSLGQSWMNVNMNRDFLDIKNGSLRVTNANGSVTIDASKLMFRILTYGNGAIVLPNGSQTDVVTITHNLGYAPVYQGQIGYIANDGNVEYYTDALSLYNTTDGTAQYNVRMFVTSTQLRIVAWRAASIANSGSKTFYYRYFIQEGVNI